MSRKPKDFEEVILFLAKTLKRYQYAIRGTASLVLQDIDMNVDDIDVLCNKETALACNELFKDFVVDPVSYKESPKFKSYFGKFKIKNVLVEIMGDWQIKNQKGNWSTPFTACDTEKKEIVVNRKKVYVTTVDVELAMFARLGRWNAFHKIKRQIIEKDQPTLF